MNNNQYILPHQLQNDLFRFVKLKEKIPFENSWQTNGYKFNEPTLLQHLESQQNIGVIGGYGKLRIQDIDDKKLADELIKKFNTFTVRTGSGGCHFYFISDLDTNFVLKNDVGEFRGRNYQVVAPNMKHPNGNFYKVEVDVPIKTIEQKELLEILKPHLREKELETFFNEAPKNLLDSTPKETDESRSAKEYKKVIELVRKGKTKEVVFSEMMLYSKWATSHNAYKELTYKKAKQFVEEKNIKELNFQNELINLILARQEDDATELIVKKILEENFIYTTRDDIKSEIWIYDNGIYKPNGMSYIQELVREFIGKAYTPQRANKIIAKIEVDTMIDTDEFFNSIYLDEICVRNGILNLKTKELTEFTPNKIFFNKLPVQYNPNASCINIDKFFEETLKDKEDKKVLYELIGFCLYKDYFVEKAFMFVGDGRNGKGKTLSLIKNFLGAENTCSVRLSQMDAQNTALCELHNRLVNLAGDLNNTALKDTGLFKELTARDYVQVKRKYLRDLIFTNYAKIIFACNELPRVYDMSLGFWSRWVLLEFPYKFLPQKEIDQKSNEEKIYCKLQNPDILEKITTEEELSGLLNKAIIGLDRLRKNKDFSYSRGTASIKDFWVRNSDSFTSFCLDNIEEDINNWITKKNLRKSFSVFCKKYKVNGTSDKNIKAVLENMFGVVEGRKGDRESQEHVWEGIKFKQKTV